MADEPTDSSGRRRRLDASGPREVVYCHLCSAEWYQSEHGLRCPACEGDITEIITPESDPRPQIDEPSTPPDLRDLHGHNPWHHNGSDSDPEEADIEEHISHGPNGSVFFSQTIRSSRPPRLALGTHPNPRRRNPFPEDDPDHVMADFQSMLGNLMGPGLRPGQTGRSGGDTLFGQGQFGGNTFRTTHGPNVVGGRFTFTTGPIRPRDAGGPHPGGPPEDLATIIANLFGPMGEPGDHDHDHDHNARGPGIPPPFQNLLASLLNPANARQGDAVYSQEALDQIISTLMEQHPTSNAPGPASPDAISALPKKNVDEKMLGPEGKAECSVCMDDVHIGDEVVSLPCTHWFHEQCAAMWLGEHNTCPICRKGIDSEDAPSPSGRRSSNSNPSPRNERRSSILNLSRRMSDRNEARLDFIRNNGRLSPTEETQGSTTGSTRRFQVVGNGLGDASAFSRPRERNDESDPSRDMPGSFSSFSRYRDERNDGRRESVGRGQTSGRENTSGSDHSRSSRRSSRSGEGTGNGAMSWLRDRFGSGRRSHD